jgi:hypothetical protein
MIDSNLNIHCQLLVHSFIHSTAALHMPSAAGGVGILWIREWMGVKETNPTKTMASVFHF